MNDLRILHLDSERTWRGGQNQIKMLCDGLAEKGCTVYVAAPAESQLIESLKDSHTVFPLRRPYFSLANLLLLIRSIRRHKIEILDAHSSRAHSLGVAVKLFLPHLKLVVHRRVDFLPLRHFWAKRKYRSNLVDAYISISSAIGELLYQAGVDSNKIHLAKSAFRERGLSLKSRKECKQELSLDFGLRSDCLWIGNTGALTEQKDYPTFLRSLALLRQNCPDFQALILGEGELYAQLKDLCQSLNLNDLVFFLGFQKDIDRFYQCFDVFFMPSALEGLGTSLLEAVSKGCSVVASQVGGIPEMIPRDLQSQTLASPGSVQEFSQLLAALYKDPLLREEQNLKTRAYIKDRFSEEAMLAANLRVYHSLL